MGLPDKAQAVFDKAVELDKKILKKSWHFRKGRYFVKKNDI